MAEVAGKQFCILAEMTEGHELFFTPENVTGNVIEMPRYFPVSAKQAFPFSSRCGIMICI
jgi:hypothetical protein